MKKMKKLNKCEQRERERESGGSEYNGHGTKTRGNRYPKRTHVIQLKQPKLNKTDI